MILKDKRDVFALLASWVLGVTFLLSFERFRSPNMIRAIVFATAAGLVMVIADNWGRWNGPSNTQSRP